MTERKDKSVSKSQQDKDLSTGLGNLEDDDFLIEEDEADTESRTSETDEADTEITTMPDAAEGDVDPDDDTEATYDDETDDEAEATYDDEADDEDIEVVTVDEDDDVPYELREDRADPASEPKTGLVSEFRDLTNNQAAWLVSNRETSAVSRSPLFYVTALVIGLAVFAALVIGLTNASPSNAGSDTTVAVVGIGEQAPLFEQQLGMGVVDAADVEEAQQLVRDGSADAALIPDPTGQGNDSLISLNSEPSEVLEKFSPQMQVTYLEPPAVNAEVSQALGWGMAFLLIASIMTLGAALYSNMRVEKRNRIAEIIAATIPPKSSAWGRIYGLSLLSLGYLVIAIGVLLLGLSIGARTSLAMSMLPGLGWFAGLFLLAHLMYLSLYLWASTAANRRPRQIGYGITVALLLAGAFAPLFFLTKLEVLKWMSWIPFTAPVAAPLRFFAAQAEWWEGLISLAAVLILGLIFFALAANAYRRNLLRGSGRSGKKAKLKGDDESSKKDRKPGKAAALSDEDDSDDDDDAKATDADDADASDAHSDDEDASGADSDAKAADPTAKSGSTAKKPGARSSGKKSSGKKSGDT